MRGMKNRPGIIFGLLILILFLVWWPNRGEMPRFWYDEAINIRLSRNLAEQGYLNLQTAPGIEYDKPYQFQTSGYPLTAPLALLFKTFGFSFTLARAYMFAWFVAFLASAYMLAKRLWGPWTALGSVALLASFPPVIYHGLSVIGEIPGVTFVLLSAYFLDRFREVRLRQDLLLFSLTLGLTVAIKPLFAPIILAAAITLHYLRLSRREWLEFAVVTALPLFIFARIILPESFSLGNLVATYASRASQGSLFSNVATNLPRFLHELSLIYLLAVGAFTFFVRKRLGSNQAQNYLLLSATFMFLLFLQGVGWNRYLLSTYIILLLFLPVLVYKFLPHFGAVAVVTLLLAQSAYTVTKSELTVLRGSWATDVEAMIETYAPEGSIYVITSAEPATLIPSERLYFYTRFEGREQMSNKLSDLEVNKFDYIISKPTNPDFVAYQSEVDKYYALVHNLSGLGLYKRIEK